jgi:hypothetical protein
MPVLERVMTVHVIKLSLFVLACLSGLALAQGYHLTGIIAATDGGKAFAVLEQADGQQRLLSVGEQYGEATVVAIDPANSRVKLQLPDGVLELRLTGSAQQDEDATWDSDIPSPAPEVITLALHQLEQLKIASLKPPGTDKPLSPEDIGSLLGLPENATVTALDDQPVRSSSELLQGLGALFRSAGSAPHITTLSVNVAGEEQRIYLVREQQPLELR